MALTDGNLSAADIAAITGANNNNGNLFGGDGAWLILILLLFAAFGNGGWGAGNGGGGAIPYMMNNNVDSTMQRGFDHQAVMAGLSAIQGSQADAALAMSNQTASVMAGLASMSNQNCTNKYDTISTLNNGHNAILQQMGAYEMARQQCCCDNKAAIADLKYTVATEACADRNAISMGVRDIILNQDQKAQMIMDKLCQQEIDALKAQNAQLQTQLNLANLAASQVGQTGQILADNAAQTAILKQALNPSPIPAYIVQNPNGCSVCGAA